MQIYHQSLSDLHSTVETLMCGVELGFTFLTCYLLLTVVFIALWYVINQTFHMHLPNCHGLIVMTFRFSLTHCPVFSAFLFLPLASGVFLQ